MRIVFLADDPADGRDARLCTSRTAVHGDGQEHEPLDRRDRPAKTAAGSAVDHGFWWNHEVGRLDARRP